MPITATGLGAEAGMVMRVETVQAAKLCLISRFFDDHQRRSIGKLKDSHCPHSCWAACYKNLVKNISDDLLRSRIWLHSIHMGRLGCRRLHHRCLEYINANSPASEVLLFEGMPGCKELEKRPGLPIGSLA
jgi:hypothetical protein